MSHSTILHSPREFLSSHDILGRKIDIYLYKDASDELNPVYQLWYDVYRVELNYPKTELIDDTNRLLKCVQNGSLIFAAFYDNECVGTIRTTHEELGDHEFNYNKMLKDRPTIEVTKLIISRKFRKTALKGILMNETQQYNLRLYKKYYICINSSERLLPFYRTMSFFFVDKEPVIHPEIGNKSYLLAIKSETFTKVCNEIVILNSGNRAYKFKWALKYFWNNRG